jgi:hypothetical protein
MDRSFSIDEEISRQYRRFNATGTQLTVRLLPPPDPDSDGDDVDPMSHFMTTMDDLFEYSLRDYSDSDMVGLYS